MADRFRHTNLSPHGTADVARPYQRVTTAKAGRVMGLYAAEGWQGAAATSMTAPCAFSTAASAAALCAVCFCCMRERSAKKVVGCSSLRSDTCDHATRTPYSTSHARSAQ